MTVFVANPQNLPELIKPYPMTAAEFFAGIGLVRLGLERQHWQIIFANDIDPQKYEMYAQNFPDSKTHFRLQDIHNLHGQDIPTVTLATASFPCNDLSLAGSYQGLAGKHSASVWAFIRILEEMASRRPPLVLLENVPSLISSHQGKDFQSILTALNTLGYLCDAVIVDALDFVPQSRARLFIIAMQGLGLHQNFGEIPNPELRPKKLREFIGKHTEIQWHLRNLPSLLKTTARLEDVLEDIPHTSDIWWNKQRTEYLRSQMSERHAAVAHNMINQDEYRYGTIFRRVRRGRSMAELRVDGVAGCLRTPRGGSGRQILFKAGCGEYFARLLTPRECARLQGTPDSYQIAVPNNQALFGFGDAVCVPVIEWIAQNYLNPVCNPARNEFPAELTLPIGSTIEKAG